MRPLLICRAGNRNAPLNGLRHIGPHRLLRHMLPLPATHKSRLITNGANADGGQDRPAPVFAKIWVPKIWHDCEPVHISAAWPLLTCPCWGFQGPSYTRRRDTTFRARRRCFLGSYLVLPDSANRRRRIPIRRRLRFLIERRPAVSLPSQLCSDANP